MTFFVRDYEEVSHLEEALGAKPEALRHNEEDSNSLLVERPESLQEFLPDYPTPSSQAGTREH